MKGNPGDGRFGNGSCSDSAQNAADEEHSG